ncbi:MAG: hypothetical protein V1746_07840, partial [bacterium]
MKSAFLPLFALLILAGCASGPEPSSTVSTMAPAEAGATATTETTTTQTESTSTKYTPPSSRPVTTQPKPWTPPSPSDSSGSVKMQYPQGKKVAGKEGLVRSPYAPHAGLVDV